MSENGPSSGDGSSKNSENDMKILKRKLAAAKDKKNNWNFKWPKRNQNPPFKTIY